MMSSTGSEISPAVAVWPIASPFEKLCRPIPMAIAMPVRRAEAADAVVGGRPRQHALNRT